MALNAKLVVVGGDVKTEEIKLRLPSTVGRGRGTTIMLAHPLVSRQHCELFEVEGLLMVRDLGSLNGTFVNNQKITEAPLPPGELLTIGTVTFRAVYETTAAVGASPASAAEKTVKTSPSAETLKAGPKASAPALKAPADDDLDFDFDKPLMPLDEIDEPNHSTERLGATEAAIPAVKAPAKSPPEKKAAAKSPAAKPSAPAKSPAPAKPTAKPPADDEDEPVASSSDDDLNDFLKSLEK